MAGIKYGSNRLIESSAVPTAGNETEMLKLAAARGAASPGALGTMAQFGGEMVGGLMSRADAELKSEQEIAQFLSKEEIKLAYDLKRQAGLDAMKRIEAEFKQSQSGQPGKSSGGSKGGGSKGGEKPGKKSELEEKGYQVRVNGTPMDWDEFMKHVTDSAVQRGINEESKILERAQREWQKLGGSKDAMGGAQTFGLEKPPGITITDQLGALKNAVTTGCSTPYCGLGGSALQK